MRSKQEIQNELNTIAMIYGDRVHAVAELQNEVKALHERLTALKREIQTVPPEIVPQEPKKNDVEPETTANSTGNKAAMQSEAG